MNGKEIKKIRKNLGLTQKQLAEYLGVHYLTVLNYEKGKTIPQSKGVILQTLAKKHNIKDFAGNCNVNGNQNINGTQIVSDQSQEIKMLKEKNELLQETIKDKNKIIDFLEKQNKSLKNKK